jgi:acetyl-CoA decarbonylase/synthase complex subunit gamma
LTGADHRGAALVRWGIGRYDYRIEPGLYAVGRPDADSPVLVTANYKLSFDTLRRELAGLDVFVLVLETMGINVWCAAGKGTFGTDELCARIEAVGLDRVVSHRRLVLPQLGAPGVAAHLVKERSGFRVKYGPVEARDVPRFLAEGRATDEMRRKRFSLRDRAVLVPMELIPALEYALPLVAVMALFAALLGPAGSPLANLLAHGVAAAVAVLAAVLSGAVVTPLLLPWIPTRAFSSKGALVGALVAAAALAALAALTRNWRWLDGLGLALLAVAGASFLALNFTGASTYTSRSGVEKELRRAVPLQAIAAAAGLVGWGLAVALLR